MLQHHQRILLRHQSCHSKLYEEQQQRHGKDNRNNGNESLYHRPHLSGCRHVEEHTKNKKWEQRNDDLLYRHHHDGLHLREGLLKRGRLDDSDAQAYQEREDQRRHHLHQRRNLQREKRLKDQTFRFQFLQVTSIDELWEKRRTESVSKQTRTDGEEIRQHHREHQHTPSTFAHVGNGRCHQSHDNQRYHEAQKLVEQSAEGIHCPQHDWGCKLSNEHTHHNGNDDFRQQRKSDFLHRHQFVERPFSSR